MTRHLMKLTAWNIGLSKTWEMVILGKATKPNPQPVPGNERNSWLKLLGIIFQEYPCCWDLHVDNLIAKASSRLYILRVCKFYAYGYSQDQLNKLLDSLILSLFAYGLEVWGSACKKYLDRIDNFCKRAYRYGYTAKADFEISTLIERETNFCLTYFRHTNETSKSCFTCWYPHSTEPCIVG